MAWSFDRCQRVLAAVGAVLTERPGRYKYRVEFFSHQFDSNNLEDVTTRALQTARLTYEPNEPAYRRVVGALHALNRSRHGDKWTRAQWWSQHRLLKRRADRRKKRRRRR